MNIDEIDRRRHEAAILQRELCKRAGVNPSTYSQIKRGHRGGYVATLQRLSDALEALIAERSEAA